MLESTECFKVVVKGFELSCQIVKGNHGKKTVTHHPRTCVRNGAFERERLCRVMLAVTINRLDPAKGKTQRNDRGMPPILQYTLSTFVLRRVLLVPPARHQEKERCAPLQLPFLCPFFTFTYINLFEKTCISYSVFPKSSKSFMKFASPFCGCVRDSDVIVHNSFFLLLWQSN